MISGNEWKRKLFHVLLGALLIALFYFDILGSWGFYWILVAGAFSSMVFTYHRFSVIKWFLEQFDRLEVVPGRGALTFVAGMTLSSALFEKHIALVCMALITVGDAAAALLGGYFGKRSLVFNLDKTVEGSLGFLIFGFLGALLFGTVTQAYLAALVGTFIEMIPFPKTRIWHRLLLDDNLLVPLIVGVLLSFL